MASRRNLTRRRPPIEYEASVDSNQTPVIVRIDEAETVTEDERSTLNQGSAGDLPLRENGKNLKRPNLTVITNNSGGSADKSQLSATSMKSHLRNFISPTRAEQSDAEENGSTNEGSMLYSSALSDEDNLRSAAVISTIDEGDLSDFKDLQDEFKNAMTEGSSTWLPKSRRNSKVIETEVQETSRRGSYSSLEPPRDQDRSTSASPLRGASSLGIQLTRNSSSGKFPSKYTNRTFDDSGGNDHDSESDWSEGEASHDSTNRPQREEPSELPLLLFGNSMGLISPNNPIRRKLATLLLKKWASLPSLVVLVAMVAILALSHIDNSDDFTYDSTSIEGILLVINAFFTLEVLAKIVAFGFWDDSQLFHARGEKYKTIYQTLGIAKFFHNLEARYGSEFMKKIFPFDIDDSTTKDIRDKQLRSSVTFGEGEISYNTEIPLHRAFARSSWNRIDLLSTVCLWISLTLSINEYDFKHRIRIFKAIGVLRVLKLAAVQDRRSDILRSLKYGLPQLLNVGFMLLYFWVFFGILGVQSFRGSLRRQCVWTNPNDTTETYVNEMQFCGGYLDPVTKEKKPYIFSDGKEGPLAKGFLCPQNSKCISGTNPYNGKVSFDNILTSMELVFVTISANTFTDIMYYTMDSDSMAASIFFVFCIFFLNIWMINLLIAVLVSSFEKANELVRKKGQKDAVPSGFQRIMKLTFDYINRKAENKGMSPRAEVWLKWYKRFEFLFVSLIFADLIMQATVSSRSSSEHIKRALSFDQAVAFVLLYESVLRLALYSTNIWKFLINPAYIFDFVISIASIIITSSKIRQKLGQDYYWFNLIQIVRFYRVITEINVTRKLWKQVLGNILLIWDLTGFYFLFLFLVSIVISVYFDGTIPTDQIDEHPFGMYSVSNTFLTLFIIGSTENWTDALYALQENSPNASSQFFGVVLLIMWFFMANFVMLNIFIAIIAESLDVKEEEKRPLQIKHYLKHVYPQKIRDFASASLMGRIKNKLFGNSGYDDSKDFRQFLFRGTAIVSIAQQYNILEDSPQSKTTKEGVPYLIKNIKRLLNNLSFLKLFAGNPFYKKPEVVYVETVDSVGLNKKFSLKLNEFEDEKLRYLKEHPMYNNSYFIFPPNHILRKFCQSLTTPCIGKRTDGVRFFGDTTNTYDRNSYFKHVKKDIFVGFISIATILMVVYSCSLTPIYRISHESGVKKWSLIIDAIFVTIFTLEFLIKTIADGLVHTPNAYLRNPWNWIDIIVLQSLWVDFISGLKRDDGLSRLFRGLTALRALRCLTISKTARSTFDQVLFDGIRKIIGAAMVSLTLLFPFAVWGLGLFRGRFGVCNDGVDLPQCYNEFSNQVFDFEILTPRVYSQPYLYMNSFSTAFRSLYEIVSLEGWVDMLSNSMASTGIGTVPRTFASSGSGAFFVLFNFLSMVFILTLFISFIIRNHARTTGSAFYTIEEKSWLEVKKLLSQVRPEPTPDVLSMSKLRSFVYRLAVEKTYFWYAFFLQAILYLHIISLLLYAYRESKGLENYQNAIFIISSSVFLVQEGLYIFGKGVRLWFAKKWDVFKFFVVFMSFCLNVAQIKMNGIVLGFTNVRDLFQLAIFLFVIQQNDILSELINTAMASLPSILSLTYTWGILFLVYAIALNQIFGLTKLGPNTTGNINFRTVIKSLIVLFRCSFGEGWNYIMDDLTVKPPFCYTDKTSGHTDCGSKPYAYMLLMSWNVLSMYIFLNMFVSLILESFSYLYHAGSGSKSVASRDEIRKFRNAWRKFDPDGVGEIETGLLPRFMHSFDGRLSYKIWEGRLSVNNLIKNYMKVNPSDPYDVEVDLVGLNKELESIDKKKIIERKTQYRRFIQEARHLSAFNNGIKFSKIIQQIPLYTAYNPQDCLGIDEFVKRLYVMGKVDKFLENERNVDVLEMVVTRWKFLSERRGRRSVAAGGSRRSPQPRNILDLTLASSDAPRTPKLDFSVSNFNWSPRRLGSDQGSRFLDIDSSFPERDGESSRNDSGRSDEFSDNHSRKRGLIP
ncbi:LAQU0S03e00408g1_1 [Lachancea quebecensis]|uniref:Calcium-channel protein CCH1 n=1 Tax=Lachancea quebecensis TaxID=1654605 RepID=A0A0P1KP08_9SACH|nr:LAQU0S03e00408g1_1 [Lachancea quebecensis]